MKKNILFASDLDNTLLFSSQYKGETDICVEHLDGQEQGFFSQNTIELLGNINHSIMFIPVTSRSMEQYKRIKFPKECSPKYAVTTNGAILLVDGEIEPHWYHISKQAVEPWYPALQDAFCKLKSIPQALRFRIVDDMFLFAACDNAQDAVQTAAHFFEETKLDVAVSGRKVYFFPPSINKGQAVQRLKNIFAPAYTISAGDTRIDVPMLQKSDFAIMPHASLSEGISHSAIWDGVGRFSEYVLEQVSSYVKNSR